MTRWARGGNVNRKRELGATPWSKLKERELANVKQRTTTGAGREQSEKIKTLKLKTRNREFTESKTVSSEATTIKPNVQKKKGKRRMGLLDKLMQDDDDDSASDNNNGSDCDVSEDEKEIGVAGLLEKMQKESSLPLESTETDEIDKVIHRQKRREKRRLKRIDKRLSEMICYNCRKQGHDMSNCPKIRRDAPQGTGICFKCGSTEHSINKCHVKLPAGVFPYAKCFICKEIGHLSKQCPDNPKGLYPNGGCCKWCSSVEHYKKDCPELKKKQGIEDIKLERWSLGTKRSADEDSHQIHDLPVKKHKKINKVIKF